MIYLDYAASTPPYPQVVCLMSEIMQQSFGNPSSIHDQGRKARVIIEEARKEISALLNVPTASLFFTSGGSEAINTAISGCVFDLGIRNIITSEREHPAVLNAVKRMKLLVPEIKVSFVTHHDNLNVNQEDLEKLAAGNSGALVILMHANNETGNLLPLKNVEKICRTHHALLLSDTVQTIGKYSIDLSESGVDFATCSAHKFHGPRGAGFLYVKPGIRINALIQGGGQERNLRSGTENVAAIAGMAEALKISLTDIGKKITQVQNLKAEFVGKLKKLCPEIQFNGTSENAGLYNTLSVSFPFNEKTSALVYLLDMKGIAVSGGSACASGAIIKAEGDTSKVNVRFSFSTLTTKDEIEQVIHALSEILC
ncbi:MAG: cysteine desulfurase [Bacteroidetes bacterium]|nr:cysteine desulfurase [Bacteroidota bacterium]MBU1718979.1 cysteine desulfurase [Bacteroidota bacterium]